MQSEFTPLVDAALRFDGRIEAQDPLLTEKTAKELRAALDRAITAADFEEAEVRGKGVVLSLVRGFV